MEGASNYFDDLIQRGLSFPFVNAKLSVHGVDELLTSSELDDIRRAVADAADLSRYGSPELRAALGSDPADWVVIKATRALNCSIPHECDDRGRRRRRLLSVDEGDAQHPPRRATRGTKGVAFVAAPTAAALADAQALLGARQQVSSRTEAEAASSERDREGVGGWQVAHLKQELAAARRKGGGGGRTQSLGFMGHWRDVGYVPGSHYDVTTDPWVPGTTKTAAEIAREQGQPPGGAEEVGGAGGEEKEVHAAVHGPGVHDAEREEAELQTDEHDWDEWNKEDLVEFRVYVATDEALAPVIAALKQAVRSGTLAQYLQADGLQVPPPDLPTPPRLSCAG
jgi:hypothetical protein